MEPDQQNVNPKLIENAFQEIMVELRAIREAVESLNKIAEADLAIRRHELELRTNAFRGSGY